MRAHHYDYVEIEARYVTGRMSLRALARQYGMAPSTIVEMAAKPDAEGLNWRLKREAYRAQTGRETLRLVAEDEARRRAEQLRVVDHAWQVFDEALAAFERGLDATVEKSVVGADGSVTRVREPAMRIQPRDVAQLLDVLPTLVALSERLEAHDAAVTEPKPEPEVEPSILIALARIVNRSAPSLTRSLPTGPVVIDA